MLTRSLRVSLSSSIMVRSSLCTSVPVTSSLCSKLCVIGGGKMAESILNALRLKGLQDMNKVYVYDTSKSRLELLRKEYKVQTCNTANNAIDSADIILLCIKPQNLKELSKDLKNSNYINKKSVVVSILAGTNMSTLENELKTNQLIRTMPNTPAMVLEGMTVWVARKEIEDDMLAKVKILLGSFGEEIQVSDESYIDMATAVSGSGPAYVFLTMEAMVDSAVHLGFPRDIAVKLVTATLKGSVSYSQQSGETLTTLRNNVTSPGGTTASALYELERGGYRTVISDALWSAYRRALELGGSNPNVGPGRNKWDTKK